MKKDILYILMLMMTAVGLSSCNEDNNTPDEYPDWKARNEEYFNKIYKEAVSDAKTNPNVKVIRNWSLPETHNKPEDFIVVKVLKKGTGTQLPLYTDTAYIHYQGRLIPSTSYPKGMIFDQTWITEEFNPNTNTPKKFAVSGVVSGFTTALQYMRAGDRWVIYIPYQLGYGAKNNNKIPAYSTLVFDVTLAGSYHAGRTSKETKAKAHDIQYLNQN